MRRGQAARALRAVALAHAALVLTLATWRLARADPGTPPAELRR